MVELLDSTAKNTSAIQDLFRRSKEEKLTVITPYLHLAKQFKMELEDLDKMRTRVTFVIRNGEKHNTEVSASAKPDISEPHDGP